jgi:hypothetical protein
MQLEEFGAPAPLPQKPPAEAGGMTRSITHDAPAPLPQKPPAEAGGMTRSITHDALTRLRKSAITRAQECVDAAVGAGRHCMECV